MTLTIVWRNPLSPINTTASQKQSLGRSVLGRCSEPNLGFRSHTKRSCLDVRCLLHLVQQGTDAEDSEIIQRSGDLHACGSNERRGGRRDGSTSQIRSW